MIQCLTCFSVVACNCATSPAPYPETAAHSSCALPRIGMAVPVNRRKGERPGRRWVPAATKLGIVSAWLDRTSFPVADLSDPDVADATYRHLVGLATLSARKGRLLAGSRGTRTERAADGAVAVEWSDPAPTIPVAHPIEDDETAADAVSTVWHRAASRGEPIDVRLVRVVARRMGARRAQHRLRERSGLVSCTDHRMPKNDAAMTLAQLVAAVPTSRRAAFERALAKANYRRARGILEASGEKGRIPV